MIDSKQELRDLCRDLDNDLSMLTPYMASDKAYTDGDYTVFAQVVKNLDNQSKGLQNKLKALNRKILKHMGESNG